MVRYPFVAALPPLTGQREVEKIGQKVAKGGVEMPPMQTPLNAEQILNVSLFVAAEL